MATDRVSAASVAALFVDAGGCYAGLPGVDVWGVARDARLYGGPLPIVAHPPCQMWGKFALINFRRWRGEHNRPGNDGGCFSSALENVRKFGGVLEHPAGSYAWEAHGLSAPRGMGWQRVITWDTPAISEWVCEVWQSAYGHQARKRTWLYFVGPAPIDLRWDRPDGTHQIGYHDQRGKARNKPTIGGRAASATPVAFRDALVQLACRGAGRGDARTCRAPSTLRT